MIALLHTAIIAPWPFLSPTSCTPSLSSYVPLFGEAGYDPAKEREAIAFEEQLDALRSLVEAGKVIGRLLHSCACALFVKCYGGSCFVADRACSTTSDFRFFLTHCDAFFLIQVRHIGLSNETPYGVMKFTELAEREGYPKVISLQNSYSLLVRSDYEVFFNLFPSTNYSPSLNMFFAPSMIEITNRIRALDDQMLPCREVSKLHGCKKYAIDNSLDSGTLLVCVRSMPHSRAAWPKSARRATATWVYWRIPPWWVGF